jgi:hypothetical protein
VLQLREDVMTPTATPPPPGSVPIGAGEPTGHGTARTRHRVRRSCLLLAFLLGVGMVAAAPPADAAPGAVDRNPACLTGGTLGMIDDGSAQLPIGETVRFGAGTYSAVYVNNNGNLTFRAPTPEYLSTVFPGSLGPMIAPYWADVDTRWPVGGKPSVVTWGSTTFGGRPAVCVNWTGAAFQGVGYYNEQRRVDKLNSFQVLLVNREDVAAGAFDIVFNYDKVQWAYGDASIPAYAQVGIDFGDRAHFFNAVGTKTTALLDGGTGPLIRQRMGSSTVDGRGVFAIRNGILGN